METLLNKTVSIKNPQLNFQKDLRFKVTKENKTTIHCRLVEFDKSNNSFKDIHYGEDYKGIKKGIISVF